MPLLTLTEIGLYCPAGDFYIDPWRPAPRAVVTHAHSDHARWGCSRYLAAERGVGVLRRRLGEDADIQGVPWGSRVLHNGVRVSLHPAGHILGSAMVRVEHNGEVWVVSGDYKTEPDPTCDAWEPVRCHTFITECTFGLPVYRWRPQQEVFDDINQWWLENRRKDRTSVLYGYSLGKAQRLLAGLQPEIGPILVHGAVLPLVQAYREAGVHLPEVQYADAETARRYRGSAIVIAPPGADGSTWLRKFGECSTAFASGWMAVRGSRRWQAMDRGFPLSDHVDWPGLHAAIEATGAESVGVTHGYTTETARYLTERGLHAWVLNTRFGESEEPSPQEPEP
jgi:putative mRNA 3-end processing factor